MSREREIDQRQVGEVVSALGRLRWRLLDQEPPPGLLTRIGTFLGFSPYKEPKRLLILADVSGSTSVAKPEVIQACKCIASEDQRVALVVHDKYRIVCQINIDVNNTERPVYRTWTGWHYHHDAHLPTTVLSLGDNELIDVYKDALHIGYDLVWLDSFNAHNGMQPLPAGWARQYGLYGKGRILAAWRGINSPSRVAAAFRQIQKKLA